MEYEPDWDELDAKADGIIARYALVSSAWNILPPPLDMMGVTATFAKMATELAGIYQVIVTAKQARAMGWAIATTTASVLGVAFAGSKLVKLIPGTGWILSALLQAPIVGAVAWAAGDALKGYFRATRKGQEPGLNGLKDSFAKTLRLKLKKAVKEVEVPADATKNGNGNGATTPPPAAPVLPSALEQIASLHELLRIGAITQEEFDAKKADLLTRV